MTVAHLPAVRERRARRAWDSPWLDLVAALLVPYLVFGTGGLFTSPPTVDRITFENPTVYDISVSISDADGSRWLPVTTIEHGGTKSVFDVIDQGEVWRLRFRAQGRAGGELVESRSHLVALEWTVDVPADVEARLRRATAPPSP